MAGNGEIKTFPDKKPLDSWFGYDCFSSTLGAYPVEVVNAPLTWDKRHVERLLATTETDGLVPTINATIDGSQLQLAQLQIFSPTLHQRLAMSRNLSWQDATGLVAATALAVDNGHLLGLRHGGLSPKSVAITTDAVSVKGMGLGRGGTPSAELHEWLAPEVLAGETPGVRSDVFSLGKLLENSLTSAKGASPAALAAVAAKATDPDFMQRHRTAAGFADAVRSAAGPTMTHYELASFGASAIGSVPAGLPVSVGLFSDDTFIDLTDSKPVADHDPQAVVVVPDADPVVEPAWSTAAAEELGKRKGGWGVLAGLIGLGALVVAGALIVGSGDEDTTAPTTTTAAPTTETPPTEAPTTAAPTTAAPTTAAPTTAAPTTAAPTTEPPTTKAPTTAAPTTAAPTTEPPTTKAPTTAAPTTGAPTTEAPTTAAPNLNDGESPVEIIHGVPEENFDIYSNGQLLVAGFAPETIAGPVDLTAGNQTIEVFPATDDAAANSQDRTDTAALAQDLELMPDQPTSIAAHLDASGNPLISAFADNRLPIPAGQSRLSLRHLGAAGPVQVMVDGELVGEPISNGEELEVELAAGEHDVVLLDGDGNELLAARLDSGEGSATTVSAVTGSDGNLVPIVQRFDGLDTAPGEVPTGDSGLKDPTSITLLGFGLLMLGAVLISAAAGATWQRRRTH